MTRNPPFPDSVTMAAWALTALTLVLVLLVHLLPALFAGLLVYELVHLATPYLSARLSDHRAKMIVVALLAAAVVGIVTAASFAIVLFIQSDPDRPAALLAQFADMVLRARETLPAWVADLLPSDHDEVNTTLVGGCARTRPTSRSRDATPDARSSTRSSAWSSAR
jgi:predicted PurR-regulated permease PerM